MFTRRFVQRNFLLRFVRNFSTNPEVNAQTQGQPSPQTINADQSNSTTEKEKAERDEQLKSVNEYKEALHFYQQGKYRISNEFFKRVLANMKSSGQNGSDNHIHVLKK